MKKLSFLLIGLLAIVSVEAQRKSSVILAVVGTNNVQASIDGTTYSLVSNTSTGGRAMATISDLSTGPHTITLTRGAVYNNNRTDDVSTTFNLRNRYDMHINLNADGSIELIETLRVRNAGGTQVRMSNAEFNKLWTNVRAQRLGEPRTLAVQAAFTNRTKYFTSAQIAQLLQLVTTEGSRLQLAKQSYAYVIDPVNFGRVESLFTSQSSRDELESYVTTYNNTDSDATVYTAPMYTAMTDASFNNLYQSIRNRWPSSLQYTSLAEAFNNSANYFTTAQVMQLLQLQTSETNRLALAKMSYRAVVDNNNFSQVYNLLSSQSSKNELAAYVAAYVPGTVITNTNIHVAMSDVEFNAMMQDVRSKFLPLQKYSTLTGIFDNSNYYFTSSQAKQLIGLVSSESNRLQLAKSAYGNVVDRTNFRTVYDLLASQSSRDELDVYVAAYRE